MVVKKTPAAEQSAGGWMFLSNHAHVLLCIARDPDTRVRDIADVVGITERAAHRILAELIAEGYATATKVGRRNRYEVNRAGRLRHPFFRDLSVGPLLDMLTTAEQRRSGTSSESSGKV